MLSLADITSVLRLSVALRYAFLTLLFIFLMWQLNVFQHVDRMDLKPIALAAYTSHHYTQDEASAKLTESDTTSLSAASTPPHQTSTNLIDAVIVKNVDGIDTEVRSRIAKVTSIFYEQTSLTSRTYEQALMTHREHNKLWGYRHFVQRRGELGPWSKHSFLLGILVDELAKPPADRLDWLFWHDADSILMNNLISLETFLPPPTAEWAHLNLLVVNDLQGLNDGLFMVRVCEWSIQFFAAGLSFPYYRPRVLLRNDEQGALNFLVAEEKFRNNTIHVPQGWFNPYQDFGEDRAIPEEWNFRLTWFEPGDMMIHFPGTTKDSRPFIMKEWLDKKMLTPAMYNMPLNETRTYRNTTNFWKGEAQYEQERQTRYWRCYHLVFHEVGPKQDDITRAGVKNIRERMRNVTDQSEVDGIIKTYEEQRTGQKREAYRKAFQEMINGTRTDKTEVM